MYNIVDEAQYFLHAIEADFSLITVNVYISALNAYLKHNREKVLGEFRDFGTWYATFSKRKYQNITELMKFLNEFFNVIFNKLLQVEISFSVEDSIQILKVFSKSELITEDFLICFSHFFKGFFDAYNFEVINEKITDNLIILELTLKQENLEAQTIQERILRIRTKGLRKERSTERKILAVSKDLAEKLTEITKKRNVTLFSYFNENILQSSILIEELNVPLRLIFQRYEALLLLSEIGAAFLPKTIYFSAAKYAADDPNWENEWYEFGIWAGNYLKMRLKSDFSLSRIAELTKVSFGRDTELDSKVEVNPADHKDYDYELKIYGSTVPEGLMIGAAALYKGVCEVLGYDTVSKEISRGICLIHLKKRPG